MSIIPQRKIIRKNERHHSIILYGLVVILGFSFSIYTGQIQYALFVWGLYAFFYALVKFWSQRRTVIPYIFTLFYVIYGFHILFTHIELIHDPYEDFYVHNDAAWSFYHHIMTYVLPCRWDELLDKTLLNPFFFHFPLSSFIMGSVGKIGQDLGVDNLRLFMRIHLSVFAAGTLVIMAKLLVKKGFPDKEIIKLLVPFGLVSYLYVTSGVFTRDLHVCFAYTLAMYICLVEDMRGRFVMFIIVFFLSFGFRPENGYLYLIYPFTYYCILIKGKIGNIVFVFVTIFIIASFIYLQEVILSGQETFDYYDERAQTLSNSGGLFLQVYNLPFPLDKISMIIYILMMPQPANAALFNEGRSIIDLPFVFSPYLMCICVTVSLYYVVYVKNKKDNLHIYILISLLVFAAIIVGSPDLRRAFAAIPGLYMCYCVVKKRCPKRVQRAYKNIGWSSIAVVSLMLMVYSLTKA